MTGAPYLPGFGRCGIPRLSTGHPLLATGIDVHGHLYLVHSGAEVCGIPHLPKPGRYGAPVISYGPGRENLRLASRHFSELCRLHPAYWSRVLRYQRVRCQQRNTFDHRLRDEDSIEWVFMKTRQSINCECVITAD
jgi:hypothetical protein